MFIKPFSKKLDKTTIPIIKFKELLILLGTTIQLKHEIAHKKFENYFEKTSVPWRFLAFGGTVL
jgi:hypothetical protein